MFTHIAVVRDLVAMQYKEYQEVTMLTSLCNKLKMIHGCSYSERAAAGQNTRVLCNSAVRMSLQGNKPNRNTAQVHFHRLLLQL